MRHLAAHGSKLFRSRVGYWATLSGITIPAFFFLVFITLWFVRRDPLPSHVRIATARIGQSYHLFGTHFCDALNDNLQTECAVPVETMGTKENVTALSLGTVDLALYQGGTFPLDGCGVVAPLYPEVVHVLVDNNLLEAVGNGRPKELDASVLRDLAQTNGPLEIFAGAEESGMRQSADEILIQHYGIHADAIHFVDRPDADIVVSTTGIFSNAMLRRLRRSDYRFLSLDASSLSRRRGHFSVYTIPKGLYGYAEGSPMPQRDVTTVATTAYLVARRQTSPKLVLAALSALYDSHVDKMHPDLITRYEARSYLARMPLHETARDYFYPFDVGATATLIEAIAGTKELLFALGAGVFLLWRVGKRRHEQEQEAVLKLNRNQLNHFVDETLAIERAQMHATDPARLEKLLDEITQLKLKALNQLTENEVRGDRMFSIFLLQCANVINKIQLKIMRYADGRSSET
jgi:TRAP-type uncharacterized transport system substrate-binding protein